MITACFQSKPAIISPLSSCSAQFTATMNMRLLCSTAAIDHQQHPMASAHQLEPLPLPWHLPQSHNQDLFAAALQDLRNLRPHLHSAAEYYEVAYLHRSQKKANAVIRSLQDYCAKVLVTSVDHLGTVSSYLDESLSHLTAEINSMDVQIACIAAKLNACHERASIGGVTNYQRMRSRKPIYDKHYNPTDAISDIVTGKQFPSLLELSPMKLEEIFQANAGSDSSTLKSLSWYLAFEASSSSAASKSFQDRKRSFLEDKNKFYNKAHFFRSLSSGQTPRCNQTSNPSFKEIFATNTSNSLRSLMALDVVENKEESIFCKIPFVSFFGKSRGVKSKSCELAKH